MYLENIRPTLYIVTDSLDPGHPGGDAAGPGPLDRRGAGRGGALLLPAGRGVAQPDGHRGLDHGEGGIPAARTGPGEAVRQPLPPGQPLAQPAAGEIVVSLFDIIEYRISKYLIVIQRLRVI